ncbi:MAG: hypothetical protein AB1512_21105 [Thermodesulfobacteriota bacterium]
MTGKPRALCMCAAAFLWLFPGLALGKTIPLPLSIEREFLNSLVIRDSFPGPGETAHLLDEQNGCKQVVVSEPRYTLEIGGISLETKVFVRAGLYLFGTCILPLSWEGYIALTQVPVISGQWRLSFKTIDSRVYDRNHQPAEIMGLVWDLIKTHVLAYLDQISVNLAPPVGELRAFLEELFPPPLHERAMRMVESLRPGQVDARPEAVTVEILTEVEEEEKTEEAGARESLRPEELDRFIARWETWDAYLVKVLESLPKDRLTGEERRALLTLLLETRQHFVDELPEPCWSGDFVRKEFVVAWQQISTVFRKRLIQDPGRPLLDYLAFFTASDALVALDRMGPGLGVEISREGLIRLARLVAKTEILDLPYQYGVDTELRDLLDLGPPLQGSGPSFDDEFMDMPPEDEEEPEENRVTSSLKAFFLGTAWAQPAKRQDSREQIRSWLVPKADPDLYLTRVRSLLNDSSAEAFRTIASQVDLRAWHGPLVLSTAWQESCFRQFIAEQGQITYLKSPNRTSVGIMQVNERVWRGVYDEKHLRWDIAYNARAGCEILRIYLTKYALPEVMKMRPEERPDRQTLARIAYAMYWGGPDQFGKFLTRLKRDRPHLIDRLFLEKYRWVTAGEWDKVDRCL